MKKRDIKARARAMIKDTARKRKLLTRLVLIAMFIMAPVTVATAEANDVALEDAIVYVGGGTATIASFALIGEVEDVGDQEVAGGQLGYTIWLAHISQIDLTKNFPKPNNAREVGSLPFKDGEKVVTFHAHTKLNSNSTGERGDLATANTNTTDFIMGGNRDVLLTFIEERAGDKFIIFYKECQSGTIYMQGSPCSPMIFQSYERNNNSDRKAITFTFQNNSFQQPVKYIGTLPVAEPITLEPTVVDTIPFTPGVDTYIIPTNASDGETFSMISGLTDDDKGKIMKLIGKSTVAAFTAYVGDSAQILLEDKVAWEPYYGSELYLRVLDKNRVAEVPGTRVQAPAPK